MKHKDKISFRLVAYTDAAGKYSPQAFRSGNEDNFYIDDDLTDSTTNKVSQDEIIQLGDLGMLMVVADGMGGMNAGEVASQIAIDTVKTAFTANSLSDAVCANAQTRQKYLEQVIKTADKNIKSEARKDRSKEGMGSTIIIAWLFGDELTISWCGDSRAYIFNEKSGIRLISQDHSYVQELVNKGLLTYDQTFDHPQNNIITRSLGDPTKDALPESKTLKVGKGDIILLCSDGLSGVLRDRKTYDSNGQLFPEENIEDIIRANTDSMKKCREALWDAAERGDWYDNVTAILCQITEGPASQWAISNPIVYASNNDNKKKKLWIYPIIALLVILAVIGAYFIGRGYTQENKEYNIVSDSSEIDATERKDSVIEKSEHENIIPEDVSVEEEKKSSKPTIQEQVREQAQEQPSKDEKTPSNELTLIDKNDENNTTETKRKSTPIKDKLNQSNRKNALSPDSHQDKNPENPNKNPQN